MALFLSTFVNRIDKKGRVSVPAQFRSALADQTFQGIIAYPSLIKDYNALEGCGIDRMQRLSDSIERLNPFSEEHDAFASLLADSVRLPFDGDGRIMLTAELTGFADIRDQVAFVGRGTTFQVWNPEHFAGYHARNREAARAQGARLSLVPPTAGTT